MTKDLNSALNRPTAEAAEEMLRKGMSVEEVAKATGIGKRIVAYLSHALALREGSSERLERLEELAKLTTGDFTNFAVKDYAAKQFCKWLFQAGMQPGQAHISTGLSIHKCRHLYRSVRAIFETAAAVIPMPFTLSARIVMSIFGSHYRYLQSTADSNSVQIAHVVVAWTRTVEEVVNNRFDLLPDFDERLLSLGSLFEVARGFREVPTRMDESDCPAGGRKVRKIVRRHCPQCGCDYVGFLNARRVQHTKCCYCELEELAADAQCREEGRPRPRKTDIDEL